MFFLRSAPPLLQRGANHNAVPRKGADIGRDQSKVLATTLRATVSPETLCTLHAPLLKSRGLVADCGGYAVTCCVEEEGEGWVVKRSKTGAGFATLFRLDFEPTAFAVASGGKIPAASPGYMDMFDSEVTAAYAGYNTATSKKYHDEWYGDLDDLTLRLDVEPSAGAAAPKGTIAVAGDSHIHIFDSEGDVQHAVALPEQASVACMACIDADRLIFVADDTMYMMDVRTAKLEELVSHVEPSGGLALFPAAKKLLFISDRNSLCELDIESKECRVIDERMEAGRLCSGTEKSALFTSPTSTGSTHTYLMPCSMSTSGSMSTYGNTQQSALDADFCVNSSGDVLFFESSRSNLTNLCKLPGLVPT